MRLGLGTMTLGSVFCCLWFVTRCLLFAFFGIPFGSALTQYGSYAAAVFHVDYVADLCEAVDESYGEVVVFEEGAPLAKA